MNVRLSSVIDEKRDLIKSMLCKDLTDTDFEVFCHICKRTGLDPLVKQIYAVARKDHKTGKNTMCVQTGIDGFRLLAERTGNYAPGREINYQYDSNGRILSATAYV